MPFDNNERTAQRSRMLGGFSPDDVGQSFTLVGWVHRRRDLGGLLFVDLRDRSGILQVSFGPDWTDPDSFGLASGLGAEDVISVQGRVERRPTPNPELPTGEVELRAERLRRLNSAVTPAIPVYRAPDEELPSEERRLRYRYLDLRREELQRALVLRHRLVLEVRNYLDGLGFVEVETPILTKPTPEGARDYLVPSRLHPGEFYALPQSPQLYKQILMASGLDRYFQIARCFRDEDLRADRQPEFTQIDVEASFVDPKDIFRWMEGLMLALARIARVGGSAPFPRLAYDEVMERFGTDRPDLRYDLEIQDWTRALADLDFKILQAAVSEGGRIRGLALTGGAKLSRREIDGLEQTARRAGAPGLLWVKRTEDGGSGPLARFMQTEHYQALGMEAGDLALVSAGPGRVTSPSLGAVRVIAAKLLGLPVVREAAWLWVTDFPLFEQDEDTGALIPGHHPFCLPHSEDLERLEAEPLAVRSHAYDLVFNGTELGSGSIRNHDAGIQTRILRLLGMHDDEIERRFGFLLEALRSGAPPHGGVALGMDRIVKHFAGARSLREVIAFPKTTAARALFEGAPTPLAEDELRELHLRPASVDKG
jgi:aspartyl-tRNA synthetase